MALALGRSKRRGPVSSENKGDGGDYGDARGEHQHFREVKAGKYRYFRHGTSLKYPTPMLGNLPTEAEL